jgi:hypothetical protein
VDIDIVFYEFGSCRMSLYRNLSSIIVSWSTHRIASTASAIQCFMQVHHYMASSYTLLQHVCVVCLCRVVGLLALHRCRKESLLRNVHPQNNKAKALATDSKLWLRRRRRLLVGWEFFALQGMPGSCFLEGVALSHQEAVSLAGNSFNTYCLVAVVVAILAHIHFDWRVL